MNVALRRLRGLSPLQADALLAIVLAIVLAGLTPAMPVGHGYRHADALAIGLAALSALTLSFRRRAPLATWAASVAPMLVYQARAYEGGPALLAPLVALYTIAVTASRRRSLALGLLTGVLMAAARVLFSTESVGTLAADAIGFIGASLFLGWAVANRRAYVAELQDRAQRAERLRIARELHDAVAHSIATINVQAGAAEHVIATHPEQAVQALSVIKTTSKQALAELREILGVLRQDEGAQPRAPAAGLAQLEGLLENARRGGLQVQLDVEGEPGTLPVAVDLAAYRILQESLTNVVRHAGTARAQIRIAYGSSALTLSVTDQGPGKQAFPDGTGVGIAGMRERAHALGGTLHAGPRSGAGFEVRASLPLEPPPPA
ncbi:MAG TPA: sensor histidine kinase [Solirubrobacteraceae bacterium]|nr:sensor histidine kinase [Solirubrobacteraceae bacterium]